MNYLVLSVGTTRWNPEATTRRSFTLALAVLPQNEEHDEENEEHDSDDCRNEEDNKHLLIEASCKR